MTLTTARSQSAARTSLSTEGGTGRLLLTTLQELFRRHDVPVSEENRERQADLLRADLAPLAERVEYIARQRGLGVWADREIAPITGHLSRWHQGFSRTPSGRPLLFSYARRIESALRALYFHASISARPEPALVPVPALVRSA